MYMPVLKDFKVLMFYTFVVPMSMARLLKLRLWKKRKLLVKFVIIIIKFIPKYINGSTSDSIISEELQQNGTLKFAKTSS